MKTFVDRRILFTTRAQFPKRSFQSFLRFTSHWRGWRSCFRWISVDNFVLGVIVVNAAVFLLWQIADQQFMTNNFSIGRIFGLEYSLKLYLAGGIGGSVFHLVHHAFLASSSKEQGMSTMDPSRTPALGASGAMNAMMTLRILLNPKATIYLGFIIPVPAAFLGNSNISGSAHLGGAAIAVVAWARLRRGRL